MLRTFRALKERWPDRDVSLVMAGAPPTSDLTRLCSELGIAQQTHWLGKVSDRELQVLYSSAEALLFPSLAEGFGWPLIEAQACGCPVVASDRAPLTEVAGDSALFFNPEQPAEGAVALHKVIEMALPERTNRRESGFLNVRKFSTEKMIDGYLELYERLLSQR